MIDWSNIILGISIAVNVILLLMLWIIAVCNKITKDNITVPIICNGKKVGERRLQSWEQ
jgi:hypothetical protein